ncbi:MmgE/PrpD family protein [Tabrizicola sp.]|uniref:MmgE/PrpD family protein n=1 Tax=Tabrizicola sp. TaxID=2005166 RepID=UPI003D2D42AC
MAVTSNDFARIPDEMTITEDAATFIEGLRHDHIPAEAIRIGLRCILDAAGLYVAGSEEHSVHMLIDEARDIGGRADARLLGGAGLKVPVGMAARVLGTAGHAHDWDDTQVSVDPAHVYGLLTHPTIPPLTAALTVGQMLGGIDGKRLMTAFQAGVEVESKISEWMLPQHYLSGKHSSGTVGTFGAFAAAAWLLGLKGRELRHGFGIAASFASGIRCNFGTMTKPLHVGRASENGVTAALLAKRGYTADPAALDGPWGFLAVMGGGVSPEKMAQGFGKTWSIVEPGVSIKPYPCGILTHPTMDLMLRLVTEADVKPEEIETISIHAGTNILKPIRYPIASNHLEAKFSLPAEVSMIALVRQAGKREFSDEFVASSAMQDMQRRVKTQFDPKIEAMGFDKVRSRITIHRKDGSLVEGWADERYRGGPDNPMTDAEVEAKMRSCCAGVLDSAAQDRLIAAVWGIESAADASAIVGLMP